MKVTLEKPVYGGECLGHVEAKAVFVPLALPGETVEARVTEQKRSFAKAELEQVIAAAPERVAAKCQHFGACGGCSYQHAAYPAQLAMKRQILRETLERAGVPVPGEIGELAAEPWGYRNRIRLAVDSDGGLGYRGRRSHQIVPVRECPIAAPILMLAAERIAEFLSAGMAPAPILEVELFANGDESQLLVTLLCESALRNGAREWLSALRQALPEQTAGIAMQIAEGGLAAKSFAVEGEGSLEYAAAGFRYRVGQGAFFQVNRRLIDPFVDLVVGEAGGGTAWDLYAGVGLFARRLAGRFTQVHAVESAPASSAGLRHNLEGTSGVAIASTTLDYLRRNREERLARPDCIVMDPPRAALGAEVCTLLNAIHAPEMVYVSCDPATLARDLRALTLERYRLERLTLVDMFPQTFHMETVAHLRRA